LVAGIAGLVNAFNPQLVIVGGGIINGYPEFIEAIRVGVPKRALESAVKSLQIVEASLHADAGVIGAAAFASTHGEING
jgi:glucokinase